MWSRPGMSAAVLPSSVLKAQIALIQAAAALWMRMEAVRNTLRSWPPRVLSVCGSPADRLRIRADRTTDRQILCVSVCARRGQSNIWSAAPTTLRLSVCLFNCCSNFWPLDAATADGVGSGSVLHSGATQKVIAAYCASSSVFKPLKENEVVKIAAFYATKAFLYSYPFLCLCLYESCLYIQSGP